MSQGYGRGSLVIPGGNAVWPDEEPEFRRAGPIQLFLGGTTLGAFNVATGVTVGTWESVGPTGSGADNTWAAMDDIPTDATAILVSITGSVVANAAGSMRMQAWAAAGDEGSPTITSGYQILNGQGEAASTEPMTCLAQVLIPLDPVDQDFKIYWQDAAQSGSIITRGLTLTLAGFVTD